MASLDPEPEVQPAFHCNLESKAPWYEILDDRPRFERFPPGIQEAMDARSRGDG